MPDTRRDQMRQAQWIKRETQRRAAQEQADALTALGVPCAVRSGWVALLDPFGLRLTLDPTMAVTPQMPTAEATRGALPRNDTNVTSGIGPGSEGLTEAHRAAEVPDFRPDDYPATQWLDEGRQG